MPAGESEYVPSRMATGRRLSWIAWCESLCSCVCARRNNASSGRLCEPSQQPNKARAGIRAIEEEEEEGKKKQQEWDLISCAQVAAHTHNGLYKTIILRCSRYK